MNQQTAAPHLNLTRYFVNYNPSEINLIRSEKIPDGAGGWTCLPPADLPPQTMRLVPQGNASAVRQLTTPDGRLVVPTFKLVGVPPIDIEELDLFTLDLVPYEVVYVSRLPAWRVTADVIVHD